MADNAILFKYTAKSVGMKYGVIPSFMAKPWGEVSLLTSLIVVDEPKKSRLLQLPGCSG